MHRIFCEMTILSGQLSVTSHLQIFVWLFAPMDYRKLGIYSLRKDSIFNGNLLKMHNGYKYEISEFPVGKKYTIGSGTVMVDSVKFPLGKRFKRVFASESFLFICYSRILEIYDLSGNLARKIESSENIVCGTGGFLVFDRVHYILNRFCETVFVTHVPNIVDFTDDGVIMSIGSPPADEDGKKSSSDLGPCQKGSSLIIQSMSRKVLYDCTEEPIVEFDGITVYRNTTSIDNIVACSSIKLEMLRSADGINSTTLAHNKHSPGSCGTQDKGASGTGVFLDCIIVLCKDCVFVIYDDIVVRKQVDHALTHIIPERFAVHNYVHEVSIYDCVLMLSCFRYIRLFKSEGIESFLVGLMNSSRVDKELYEKFIDVLRVNEGPAIQCNTILCRVYRQVDDRLKGVLDHFIGVDTLGSDDLYYLVIYKPDLTERFVQMCKKERRLFYLDDLRLFFEKTNRVDELKRIFLRNGILIFEYCGLEKLIETERTEINAQKACFLASVQ